MEALNVSKEPEKRAVGDECSTYNPFENRKVKHPTNDFETLIHFVKGCLGSGILSMPFAFLNAGLWFGFVATFIIGVICTYCVHILIKCAYILCQRIQVPSLDYAGLAEAAFLCGHENLKKWSRLAHFLVRLFLVLYQLGTCCIYVTLIASSIQQVVEFHSDFRIDIRLYILMLLLPLILSNFVRELKYLVYYSLVANITMCIGLGCTLYYILTDLPATTERDYVGDPKFIPMFFGIVIFALEGIGVVMPLENNMKNPNHFLGCPGVLNIGMALVTILYATFGFLGFLRYGTTTDGSITLNLPMDDVLAQSVKLIIAVSIFLTYSLQFYTPMEIFWQSLNGYFKRNPNLGKYIVRNVLVTLTVIISIIVPNIGPFMSLIGAISLSTLGIIFPAIIETNTYWHDPGLGRFKWRLIKNVLLITFGLIGFSTGTYVSILGIIESATPVVQKRFSTMLAL